MAVVDEVAAAPQYVKPDYSAGDKAAAVFGNNWGMDNKRNQAAFENAANMYKWTQENGDVMRKKGLLKAGINPLVAYSQGVGSPQSASTPNASYEKSKTVQDLIHGLVQIITSTMVGKGMYEKYTS